MTPRGALRGVCIPRPGWFAVLLTAVALTSVTVMALLRTEEWVGWLPSTIGVLELASVWMPSLLATSAAWISGQPRAHGMAEWVSTSPRSQAQRNGVAVLLVGISGVLGLCLACGVVISESLRSGLDHGMSAGIVALWIPTMVTYAVFWSIVGAAAGALLPRTVALPLGVLVPYVVYAVLDVYAANLPVAVFAVNGTRFYDYVRPATDSLVVRLVFWSVAAAVAALALVRRWRLVQRGVWALSVAAAIALFVGPHYVPIAGAQAASCAGRLPQACLDGSHITTMPRYRSAIEDLWPSIPEPLRPDVVTSAADLVTDAKADVLVAPPVAGVTEPARMIDPTMFAARLGDALFLDRCTDTSGGFATAVVLERWWRDAHGVPVDGTAFVGDVDLDAADLDRSASVRAAEELAALTPERRRQWFATNASAIRDCRESTPVPVA